MQSMSISHCWLAFQPLLQEKYLIHFMFSFYQEFKMFLLCFAVLVAATSAAKVCKCEDKKVNKGDAF